MSIGPSWRPEATFSLLWPLRRSVSADEKFVAELSREWTYVTTRGCEVMYVVLCELALSVATTP